MLTGTSLSPSFKEDFFSRETYYCTYNSTSSMTVPFIYFIKQCLIDVSDSLPSLPYMILLLFVIFIPSYRPYPSPLSLKQIHFKCSLHIHLRNSPPIHFRGHASFTSDPRSINKPLPFFLFLLLQQPHALSKFIESYTNAQCECYYHSTILWP